MGRPEQASTWFLKILAAACEAHRLEPGPIFEAAGLSPEVAQGRGERVPLDQARAAWTLAARRSGDALFGLHAAERLPPGSFDVLDYLGRSMPTLGQMLERICQLASIFTEDGALTLSRGPRSAVFRHSAKAPLGHVSDLILASVVLRGRELTTDGWAPRRVGFIHPAPGQAAEYSRVFQAPVRFAQPADELYLESGLLDLPLKTYEPKLSSILDDYVSLVMGRSSPEPAMLTDVGEAISAALSRGEPRLEDIARRLKVTPRTLQRRLSAAGTSFQRLIDHLRHQLAIQYQEDRSIPTSKLALMLGFSEPSAFYRAQKRWARQDAAGSRPPAGRRS